MDLTPSDRPDRKAITARAQRIADEMWFPDAMAIDRSPLVPAAYLDALADAGLYGLFAPRDAGGFDADPVTGGRVIEALGGASLTAAFVWIQHHSALRAAAGARPDLRDRWLPAMSAGRVRSGIAFAALRRPGPPAMRARPTGDGWQLFGEAPWVTGWDRIDVVYVGARHGEDIVWLILDAEVSASLTVAASDLAAMTASSTVTLRLAGHRVAADRVVKVEAWADWTRRDALSLRTNGYLAVGVAARAAALAPMPSLTAAVDRAREDLDRSEGQGLIVARAAASLLAVQAASALVVRGGGRSVELHDHAQRLAREAMFLLVFGQTATIKAAQLAALTDLSRQR